MAFKVHLSGRLPPGDVCLTLVLYFNSIFYFGWLIWAIPSNLIMQRSPPAYYLSFNIFMWGAVLMYVPLHF